MVEKQDFSKQRAPVDRSCSFFRRSDVRTAEFAVWLGACEFQSSAERVSGY